MRHSLPALAICIASISLAACGTPSTLGSEPTAEPTAASIPGEAIAWHLLSGRTDTVDVVGVDGTLKVHALPGDDQPTIAELSATARGVQITGVVHALDSAVWVEVDLDSGRGWVPAASVMFVSDLSRDVTDQLRDALEDDLETLTALAARIGAVRSAGNGEGSLRFTVAQIDEEYAVITVDVLGFADDSVAGERLVVRAVADHYGWLVDSAESTPICWRGRSEHGCI